MNIAEGDMKRQMEAGVEILMNVMKNDYLEWSRRGRDRNVAKKQVILWSTLKRSTPADQRLRHFGERLRPESHASL